MNYVGKCLSTSLCLPEEQKSQESYAKGTDDIGSSHRFLVGEGGETSVMSLDMDKHSPREYEDIVFLASLLTFNIILPYRFLMAIELGLIHFNLPYCRSIGNFLLPSHTIVHVHLFYVYADYK